MLYTLPLPFIFLFSAISTEWNFLWEPDILGNAVRLLFLFYFILLFSFTCLCFNLVFIILFVKLDWKFYVLVSEMPYSRKTGSIKDRCRHVLSYPFCKCLLFILINLLWSIGKENCTCRFHLYVPSQVAWIKDYFKWTVIKFHSKLTV